MISVHKNCLNHCSHAWTGEKFLNINWKANSNSSYDLFWLQALRLELAITVPSACLIYPMLRKSMKLRSCNSTNISACLLSVSLVLEYNIVWDIFWCFSWTIRFRLSRSIWGGILNQIIYCRIQFDKLKFPANLWSDLIVIHVTTETSTIFTPMYFHQYKMMMIGI